MIAANKQDLPDAWAPEDLRYVLGLHPDIKVLECIATDKESVKHVLLELLYSILETYED